jgi:prepilin-type N-terminal cleavage/methylation domain-containing protein
MSRGFTLIELALTVIVVSILGGFTFSVIWQYSDIYATVKQGSVYSEAAAVTERMTRELRDAASVDSTAFPSNGSTSTYIILQIEHATPADKQYLTPVAGSSPPSYNPYWVQYCTCTPAGGKKSLYRVLNGTTDPGANSCSSCPPGGAGTVLMSGNVANFQVQYIQGNAGSSGPDGNSYQITLQAQSAQVANGPSITLVSRVTPRNYVPYNSTSNPTGVGSDRDFSGNYYDEID